MLVGECPKPLCSAFFNAGCASLRDTFEDVNRHILRKIWFLFGVRVNRRIWWFMVQWQTLRVVRFAHEHSEKELLNVDTIYLLPGEDRCYIN